MWKSIADKARKIDISIINSQTNLALFISN